MPIPTNLPPFALERFFAQHEFTARYLMCASDGEALSMAELLTMADDQTLDMWRDLSLSYTESPGHPLLRQEIAGLYDTAGPEDTLALVPEEGILLAMSTLLQPGDRVVAAWPAYQSLHQIATTLGCEVVRWEPDEVDGVWTFSLDKLDGLLTEDTTLLVINFPHNPTGAHLNRLEQARLMAMAEERGVRVFSDEMYRGAEHDPADRLPSAVDLSPNAVALGGLSKAYTLPGLRMGWLVTRDRDAWSALAQAKDYTTICHAAPSEVLAIMALRARDTITARLRGILVANLDALDTILAPHADRLLWRRPAAATVGFANLPGDADADAFCQELLNATGVLLAPASKFLYDGPYARLGFGRNNLPECAEQLAAYLAR